MKIGLFSDIHLEHRSDRQWPQILERILDTLHGVDLIVNAGDTHHDPAVRKFVEDFFVSNLRVSYIETQGNHDFYGHSWDWKEMAYTYHRPGDLKVFGSTMWTDFGNNPLTMWKAQRYISDFRAIVGVTPDKMMKQFKTTLELIETYQPDVVITHFAPSPGSIVPRFQNDDLNSYFCPDALGQLKHIPKLWLHGHIHDHVEYDVFGCKVISNPLGYPGETYKSIEDYSARIIKV